MGCYTANTASLNYCTQIKIKLISNQEEMENQPKKKRLAGIFIRVISAVI
jgi:hypothetical protein